MERYIPVLIKVIVFNPITYSVLDLPVILELRISAMQRVCNKSTAYFVTHERSFLSNQSAVPYFFLHRDTIERKLRQVELSAQLEDQ